jgi:hypothetical protein
MRKLSFEENLRHRLRKLPHVHLREEKSFSAESALFLTLGAVAGVAAGVLLAQKYGGFGALTAKLRSRSAADDETSRPRHGYAEREEDEDEYEYDEDFAALSPLEQLEERVLEAYRNDPILCERAIDIGAIDDGLIELTGWVHEAEEADHAVTVARGTPGVTTVVNRLTVRDDEDRFDTFSDRYAADYDSFTESHWEGQTIGMGRPRQGDSSDSDRHTDPKPELEDRWMNTENATRNAADDTGERGERRPPMTAQPGGETDGSANAPSGVPKGDHVSNEPSQSMPPERGSSSAGPFTPPPRGD